MLKRVAVAAGGEHGAVFVFVLPVLERGGVADMHTDAGENVAEVFVEEPIPGEVCECVI